MSTSAVRLPVISTVADSPLWMSRSLTEDSLATIQRTDFTNQGRCKRSSCKNKVGVHISNVFGDYSDSIGFKFKKDAQFPRAYTLANHGTSKTRYGDIDLAQQPNANPASWASNYKHDFIEKPINFLKNNQKPNLRYKYDSESFCFDKLKPFDASTTYRAIFKDWIAENPNIFSNNEIPAGRCKLPNKAPHVTAHSWRTTDLPATTLQFTSPANLKPKKPLDDTTTYLQFYRQPVPDFVPPGQMKRPDQTFLFTSPITAADANNQAYQSSYSNDYVAKPFPSVKNESPQQGFTNINSMSYKTDRSMGNKLMSFYQYPENIYATPQSMP